MLSKTIFHKGASRQEHHIHKLEFLNILQINKTSSHAGQPVHMYCHFVLCHVYSMIELNSDGIDLILAITWITRITKTKKMSFLWSLTLPVIIIERKRELYDWELMRLLRLLRPLKWNNSSYWACHVGLYFSTLLHCLQRKDLQFLHTMK